MRANTQNSGRELHESSELVDAALDPIVEPGRPYDRVIEHGRIWRVEVAMGGQMILIDEGPAPAWALVFEQAASPGDRDRVQMLPPAQRRAVILAVLEREAPLTIAQLRKHAGPHTRPAVAALRRAGRIEKIADEVPARWRLAAH